MSIIKILKEKIINKNNNYIIKITLLLIFVLITNSYFPNRFIRIIQSEKLLEVIGVIIMLIISLWTLFYLIFIENFYIKLLFAILICSTTFFSYSYYLIMGSPLSYSETALLLDANQNINDAFIMYLSVLPRIVFVLMLFIVSVFLKSEFKFKNKFLKKTYVQFLLIVLPMVLISLNISYKVGIGLDGLNDQFKAPAMLVLNIKESLFGTELDKMRKNLAIEPDKISTVSKIVLIVDESIRPDYLDINKDTGLTPYLKSIENKIINYGAISSAGNCSASSNLLLRTGASMKDIDQSVLVNPYIWDYAHNAGYKTIYIDAQGKNNKRHNDMTRVEHNIIKEKIQFNGSIKAYERDVKTAHKLKKYLKSKDKLLIFINKNGCHFPFSGKYPPDKEKFTPIMSNDVFNDSREQIVNTYKNSLSWSVDEFFRILNLNDQEIKDYLLIYTSDHGVYLKEDFTDGIYKSHCSPKIPSVYEGLVPLFIITDNYRIRKNFERGAKINYSKSTHFNITPTIISILGYDLSKLPYSYDKTLFEKIKQPQKFVYSFKRGRKVKWKKFVNPI